MCAPDGVSGGDVEGGVARCGDRAAEDARFVRLGQAIATSPHNLVGRRDRATVTDVHIPECRAIGETLSPAAGTRWMDLGTGGGLPGLVLAVAHPRVEWTLVEATAKKAAAVAAFAHDLDIDVQVHAARAESLAHDPAHRGAYAGVVARAVAPMPTLVELARGFLAPGGMLHAVKGPRWTEEVERAEGATRSLRLRFAGADRVAAAERPTWIVRYEAIGGPPRGFPRRDGVPKADPLR